MLIITLIEDLKNLLPEEKIVSITETELDIEKIWKSVYDNKELTFIDLVKGIIPLKLSDIINEKVKKKEYVKNILLTLNKFITEKFWSIWKDRCNILELEDKEVYNITKKEKKLNRNIEHYPQNRIVSNTSKWSNLGGLKYNLYFGYKILDFTITVVF